MTYEIKSVGEDAVTLSDFGTPLMRIITQEVEPGKFVQVPVIHPRDAKRIVRALNLAGSITRVVTGSPY